jgi:hemerythrin
MAKKMHRGMEHEILERIGLQELQEHQREHQMMKLFRMF